MSLRFSGREKNIMLFLICLLVGYGMYVGVYEVFWVKLNDTRQQINMAQQQLSQKNVLVEQLSAWLKRHGAVLEQFRQIDSDGNVRSKILATLQGLAAREQVRIADIKPRAVKARKSSKEFSVGMMLEGDFVAIMKFLYHVESDALGFRIKEFRFSQSYAGKSDLRCQVVVSKIFLPEVPSTK